jgi:hypothetical protein
VLPLSADDFVQESSGSNSRPAGSTSLVIDPTTGSNPGWTGTTAGNTLLLIITSQVGLTTPAGFSADKSNASLLWVYSKSEVAAGETSWTVTFSALGATAGFSWYVAEVAGVDPAVPLEVSATAAGGPLANGATLSSGTTPQSAALDVVVLAAFAVQQAVGSETQSWSGYTNDYEELADVASNVAGAHQLAVARKVVSGATGQFETTATLATSASTAPTKALIVAYRAANSPIVAPLTHFLGFGWGTHGGLSSHSGVTNMMGTVLGGAVGTWGTNHLIQAASARSSGYGLRIVQSGSAAYVRTGDLGGINGVKSGSFGKNVRVVSATGTVVVAEIANNAATLTFARLMYDTSTSKFGVRCGTTGTIQWQSGTTALNTWVWVDFRVKVNTTVWRVEWRIETAADTYTGQTAAELTGQDGGNGFQCLHFGANAAQTVTADFADVCLSTYYAAYPLTPHQVRLLTVDPAGTPTLSGTSTNFSVFTANGTLAAWNAVNARNAVDEVPPTVSASADGVCQTAVAASDYIEFPMAAPTLADDEIVAGVRMLAAMWGGTGTGTGTVGIRSWDGTTETTMIDTSVSYDAGSPTAVSSTEPRWQCAMWPSTNGWTQAELDALALRFGFSTDATPDMGVHVLYLEYATRKAVAGTVVGEAGGVALESNTNPNTTGTRSVTLDTPADQGATLNWSVGGTPDSQAVAASSSHTETLDAADAAQVDYVEVVSENELADRE